MMLPSFLRHSFLTLLLFFVGFSVEGTFAAPPSTATDITKPGYMIDLQNMNPVKGSQTAPTTSVDTSGKGAALFLLGKLASILLFILPIIAGIAFIIAGYYYVLSGGDAEKATQAKTIIKWNLIAIIVALFSYALVKLVAKLLGGTI